MKVSFPLGRLQFAELRRAATAPHEGAPVGVPYAYGWAEHGNIEAGISGPPTARLPFVTGWGQCFAFHTAGEYGSVHVRSIQAWANIAGQWSMLTESPPTGGIYAADFANDISTPAKPDNAGVLSSPVLPGQALHFFTASRVSFPEAASSLMVVFQARADADGAFLIGAGADYWPSTEALYPNNRAIGEGQLCFVTSGWEWYGVLYEA